MYEIIFVPKYDIVYIVCAVIVFIVVNVFFIENPPGATAFVLLFISYGAGRYVGNKASGSSSY